MKSTKLSTLFLPAAAMLLVSQFVFAQQRPSIRPDKTLVAKAIAAAQTTGKAVPIVPASTIKALAAARPTIWLTNGNALAAKSKPAAKPAGSPASEPWFCDWNGGVFHTFCPFGVETAYGTNKIVGANGGAGMTIAIVDAFAYPGAEADLAQFNSDMGLPACTTANGCFTSINLSPYDGTGSGWDVESDLDIQYAHAMAPKAKIIYVQAYDNSYDSFGAAELFAATQPGVVVVSNSWSGGTYSADDFYWNLPVPLLFASGDGASWPSQGFSGYPCSASEPSVTCIGGTSLYTTSSLVRTSEVGWAGSGGGCANGANGVPPDDPEYIPWWQGNNGSGTCGIYHASPDIAAIADPYTGVAVFITDPYWNPGHPGYYQVGGTSLATPITAGLLANIDAALVSFGKPVITALTPSLYKAATANYNYFFYDVTSGNNGYAAGPQFDLVTGLGNLTGKDAANRFFGLIPVTEPPPPPPPAY
jgi:subtilase family serine protease